MTKTLLTYFSLFLLPLLSAAQNEPQVIEDFVEGVKATNTFTFNDHLNVMQVSTDDANFDLIGINDKMQVVWRTSLAGYGIKTDKLKGKVIALASSDHSAMKGTNNTFVVYVLDPANGKLLANKTVYKSSDEYVEFPQMYTGEGEFFKLAVRQTSYRRKIHVVVPLVSLFTERNNSKELNDTRGLTVVEFNDKLDSVKAFKPVISNGLFVSLAWNRHADMFIGWLNGPSIEIYKYDVGKTAPSNQLTVPVDFEVSKYAVVSGNLYLQSAENLNVLYYSMVYLNQRKDAELGIGKLDFATNKKAYVVQVLDKTNLKAIKKGFIPINKDLDDVELGDGKGMTIKYMNETSGRVIVGIASDYSLSSSVSRGGMYMCEDALLINGFDQDLQLKYQQVLPANSAYPNIRLTTGYHVSKNKLYVLANTKKGFTSILGVYGVLDIGTGKWDKMERLSKKNLDNGSYSAGQSILWFGNSFVVPYLSPKTFSAKSDISLQLNNN